MLASGSRDLDGKEVKPKAAGKYFHGWDEKYGPSLGSNVETEGGSRGGGEEGGNLFLLSCSWAR